MGLAQALRNHAAIRSPNPPFQPYFLYEGLLKPDRLRAKKRQLVSRKAATLALFPHAAALQNMRRCAFVRSKNPRMQSAPAQRFTSSGSSLVMSSAICEPRSVSERSRTRAM